MITHDQIRNSPSVVALLGEYFDFEVCSEQQAELPNWIIIEASEVFITIGSEGAGGIFLLRLSNNQIIFVTSEGAAGCIANNLTQLMQLFAAHPNWQDILHFSGNGQLSEMRRIPDYFEESLLDDYPDIDEARLMLLKHLDIAPSNNPIENLHACVSNFNAGVIQIKSQDGELYESLFNKFTLDDHPKYKSDNPK